MSNRMGLTAAVILVLALMLPVIVTLPVPQAGAGIQAGISVDSMSRAQVFVDFQHHEIHAGDHYIFSDFTPVASGANRDYLMITPNTTAWSHLVLKMSTNQGGVLHLFEGATVSANGTAIARINNNRNSGNTSATTVFHTPTVTTTGTEIATFYMTVDAGAARVGIQERSDDEFILKQNTIYLLRFTGETIAGNNFNIRGLWYEHISGTP